MKVKKTALSLKNETGLHARPASLLVKEALKFESKIKIIKDNQEYNAKSIISVLSMGAGKGAHLTIVSNGRDEVEALAALEKLINSSFEKQRDRDD